MEMMDYYGSFPPPSREDAIEEVIKQVQKSHNPDNLREICERVVNDMPSLGSYTGWYVSFRSDAVKTVLNKIHNTPFQSKADNVIKNNN